MDVLSDSPQADATAPNWRDLLRRYENVRSASVTLISPLDPEDTAAQSMPDASPAKWHLAHTTWFFETFLLREHLAGYKPFHPKYIDLFNSYYNAVGQQFTRSKRGLLTRPNLDEILAYRDHVDQQMAQLLEKVDATTLAPLIEIGLNHEQQHQELMVMDIKHLLSINPLEPVYCEMRNHRRKAEPPAEQWLTHDGGVVATGYLGKGFCFDNEQPVHRVFLQPFALAASLVTCGAFLQFMEAGGYDRSDLWLSDGWQTRERENWQHPLYWQQRDGHWYQFTLHGTQPVQLHEPVCHLSYYEADAFARWTGYRLPSEHEWETVARQFVGEGPVSNHPRVHPGGLPDQGHHDFFGQVWQWTHSSYGAYPGFRVSPDAIGEYNGKFMCNQLVLRGGSCATPNRHARATYRNFFYPHSRWQFSGIRLAKDLIDP